MQVENELQVADAKQAFLRWNTFQYENLPEIIPGEVYKYIQLIPLFLQINNRLLPGYTGPDTPLGVYAYKPDKNAIADARQLNNKFRYQQEGVVKNPSIDSVLFQQQVIDKEIRCWIFFRPNLNKKQVILLKEKVDKISQWFSLRGCSIDFICLTDDDFRNNKNQLSKQINQSLYLDYFYSEIIVLAGKYPVWWLVPPTREKEYTAFVEHIKQARFVDNEEFIDLGGVADLSRADLLQFAVDQVQKIKLSPEICLVQLLLIDQKTHPGQYWMEYLFVLKIMFIKNQLLSGLKK